MGPKGLPRRRRGSVADGQRKILVSLIRFAWIWLTISFKDTLKRALGRSVAEATLPIK
jgi:hypothetical protein